ncbi:HAAS signaling domain-containing protein [Bacillus solimangrovi]|uniref:DUF1700 domain-containing protein n=1 Tax=Bacillus solimangrovi TaxID=1305675 RepID=A0A1E5LF04_9BACI|nr:DUF1700 domain-containing protein [Bacillus solimangrovi]OEH92668.1 hypothetical protein BFG57_01290 [Bacillus solimangrovi]
MNKHEFFLNLEHLLAPIPEYDRKEIIYDYEEHFEVGMENGKSENELIAELGSPQMIARDLLSDYRIERAEKDKSVKNLSRAIFETISLSLLNIVFVLGPVIGLIGVFVSLCATSIILTLSPVLMIVSILIGNSFGDVFTNIFVAITLCSLGLIMGIGMIHVGKFFYNMILRYIKFNIQIVKGGKRA